MKTPEFYTKRAEKREAGAVACVVACLGLLGMLAACVASRQAGGVLVFGAMFLVILLAGVWLASRAGRDRDWAVMENIYQGRERGIER